MPDSSNSDQEPVTDNGFAYAIDPGLEASCYLFDLPTTGTQAYEAGTILVYNYICPPGFADTNPGIVNYSGYCVPESGTEFTASHAPTVRQAVTDERGISEITGVPTGSFRLSALPREGYDPPRVYCNTTLAETGARSDLEEISVDNWGIPYDLPAGYYLACVWYNLPAAQPSTDPATIILSKYTCPEDSEDTNQSRDELLSLCTVRPEGVEFTVEAPPLSGNVLEGSTSTSGGVQFTGVTPGKMFIDEVFNQGYIPLSVYCDTYVTATGSATNYLRNGVAGSTLSTYIAGGYTLECHWFNFAYVELVDIHILKYYCPPNYGVEGVAREDVLFACASPAADVVFEVSSEADYLTSSATDAAGSVEFEGVPPGPLLIAERAVAYEALKVYCGETGIFESTPPATWQELPIIAESVEYEAQPGTRITCYWINSEVEYPHVVVHKYACFEAAAPAEPVYEAIKQSCTPPLQDVTFELSAGGATESQTTDSTGYASWFDVPVGTVTLTETPPAGYPVAIVFCAVHSAAGEQREYQQVQTAGNGVEFTLAASYFYVECDWFNYQEPPAEEVPAASPTVPSGGDGGTGGTGGNGGTGGTVGSGAQSGGQAGGQTGGQPAGPTPDPDAPATLVITKYTCEPGYDVHDPESDPVEDCEDLTGDIEFALAVEGEDGAETRVTGDDGEGRVEFAELDAGAYLLTETLPENILSAFIYTCRSDQRAFQAENPFVPFAYAGPDGQIGVVLIAGETLECEWYDVPAAVVTVIKYQCPGVQVNVAACEIATESVTIVFEPVGEGGESYSLTTDETGTASADMAPGAYQVTETPESACLIDSEAFDLEGNLVVEEGEPIEIRVYNCGPQPIQGGS